VPEADARTLILLGKAVAAEDTQPEEAPVESELTTDSVPEVVGTDKQFKRGKPRKGSK